MSLPLAGAPPGWADWALPLGISFYTFHMLSVMIDVYRGEWTHRISFRAWWLYVTFFPHMIAGPILRASELVEQLENLQPLKAASVKLGALVFMAGLIKKVLFADNLSLLTDELFSHPDALDFYMAWLATTAFALQIYFDFSGYSEMAIGLALVFGVTLPRNFLHPYTSRSVREFWQRWHITLSRWLRDYLYFSLGGNRRGKSRNLANLMITMLLGGLWHGAAWTFVFWGFLHGGYLVLHRLLLDLYSRLGVRANSVSARGLSWLGWPVTLALVWVSWVFFRAHSFHDAWIIVAAMLGLGHATEGHGGAQLRAPAGMGKPAAHLAGAASRTRAAKWPATLGAIAFHAARHGLRGPGADAHCLWRQQPEIHLLRFLITPAGARLSVRSPAAIVPASWSPRSSRRSSWRGARAAWPAYGPGTPAGSSRAA